MAKEIKKPVLKALAILGVAVVLFVLVSCLTYLIQCRRERACRMLCRQRLGRLGRAIMLYAGGDADYRAGQKWGDVLVGYVDVELEEFICEGSDAVSGESSYAFNKYLTGQYIYEVGPDVVLLFETNFGIDPNGREEVLGSRGFYKILDDFERKGWLISEEIKKLPKSNRLYKSRWNQFGGPGFLTIDNHEAKGCNVLFHDGRVEFIRREDIDKLKWQVEETEKHKAKSAEP